MIKAQREYSPIPLTLTQMKYIVIHWLYTNIIEEPAKGDSTYIGFPRIPEAVGQTIAKELSENGFTVAFIMGEFVRPRST